MDEIHDRVKLSKFDLIKLLGRGRNGSDREGWIGWEKRSVELLNRFIFDLIRKKRANLWKD